MHIFIAETFPSVSQNPKFSLRKSTPLTALRNERRSYYEALSYTNIRARLISLSKDIGTVLMMRAECISLGKTHRFTPVAVRAQ